MPLRTPAADVRRALASALRRDLTKAAGDDRALQTHERASLTSPLATAAALSIDDTDLPVDDLVTRGLSLADAAWAKSNQASGPGAPLLSQAELRAIAADPDAGRDTLAAVDVVHGRADAAALRAIVDESVRNTFGVGPRASSTSAASGDPDGSPAYGGGDPDGSPADGPTAPPQGAIEMGASRVYAGRLVVDARVANGAARLTLGRDADGRRAVVDARFLSTPTVVDPSLSASLSRTLRDAHGLVAPEVMAAAPSSSAPPSSAPSSSAPSSRPRPAVASTTYQVLVAHGPRAARTTEAIALTFFADGTSTKAPGFHDDAAARAIAAQLAVRASLAAAAQLPAPSDRLAPVEVFLKRDALDPASFARVAAADSPVGFDAARELQYEVPALLGDLAVYVTVDTSTGAARADLFN